MAGMAAQIFEAGGPGRQAPTDLYDRDGMAVCFAMIRARYRRLDLLFNKTGAGAPPGPLEELRLAQWQMVGHVNLTAPVFCRQEASCMMKAQHPAGGRIINAGSISADAPRPNSAPYTASEHAISGLTQSVPPDSLKYNVAVGLIDMGDGATATTARMAGGVLQPDGSIRAEPMMEVGHVIAAVACMAGLPLAANVQFMTAKAPQTPFVGSG